MTKRDYVRIAKSLRDAKPQEFTAYTGDDAKDAIAEAKAYGQRLEWKHTVNLLCFMFKENDGQFVPMLFLVAAGEEIRPDGSMYPMDWTRGVIIP